MIKHLQRMEHNKLFYWVASVLSLILHLGVGLLLPEDPLLLIFVFYIVVLLLSGPLAICGVYIKLPGTNIIDNPKSPVYAFDGLDRVIKYEVKYTLPDSSLFLIFPFLFLFRVKGLEEVDSYCGYVTDAQIEDMNNLVKSPEEVYKECEQKGLENDKVKAESQEKFKLINKEYYANFK